MEVYVKNTLNGLIPVYPSDLDEKKKLNIGKIYKGVFTLPRNYEFHKKFMAMVNIGHNNTKLDMPFNTYRKYLTMKAGYFNSYTTPKGVFLEAESISFANMSQDEFEEVYSRVMDEVIKDIKADEKMINEQLISFM